MTQFKSKKLGLQNADHKTSFLRIQDLKTNNLRRTFTDWILQSQLIKVDVIVIHRKRILEGFFN